MNKTFTKGGMPFKVDLIADSTSFGARISTFALTYPRFIHAQMMTHRMLSRNAQSSRAMPVNKMLQEPPVIPTDLRYNQKGMQPAEPLTPEDTDKAIAVLRELHDQTMSAVSKLNKIGVHKQWANRYLEPFRTITAIYTGTDDAWQAFFALRAHPDAQEEICWLAQAIKELYDTSTPEETSLHMPFVTEQEKKELPVKIQFQLSSARSARVSYLTFEGTRDVEKDKELHDRLSKADPPHLSPLEHCAVSDYGRIANFNGWRSYRNMVECGFSHFEALLP